MGFDAVSYSLSKKLKKQAMLKSTYDADEDDVIDWKALQLAGVRQEVLQNFTDPKILIATSSMNEVLNSADLVEAQAGNISSTSEELTIIGGTSSAVGTSWIYWNLPIDASKVYAKVKMNSVNDSPTGDWVYLSFADSDGSTLQGPPNEYKTILRPWASTQDFSLHKYYNGTGTWLAHEAVELSSDTYYEVEFYWEHGVQKIWRDGSLKFNISDTDITSIKSVRFITSDNHTTYALIGKFKGYVIIIYE